MSLAHATHKSIGLFSLSGKTLLGKIVNVYDADTCKIVLDKGDNTLEKYCCRLLGIDTPEMKPSKSNLNRDLEIESAYNARNRLIQLATSCNIELENRIKGKKLQTFIDNNNKIVIVDCFEFDKYGRLLVKIYENIPTNKISYNETLVNEGYAYKYYGGTKKKFKS
jgi:endonuclease YncB( thermonuclease family)